MLDYCLTEHHSMIKDLARTVAENKIKPFSKQWDEKGEYPTSAIEALAQSDLFAIWIPEKYNGLGGGVYDLCLAVEEIARIDGGVATAYAATFLGMAPILIHGTEEQKEKYLTQIASGEAQAAFGLTEPAAGSDASKLRTTAVKDGDYYVLNGLKHFITNGGEAAIYAVIALTDKARGARGMSCFIVEKGTPGFSFGKKEDKLGIRCSTTSELIFEDCRVHKDNLLGGREGLGFIATMKTFDYTRPGVGAQAVGIAQGAMELAVKYAHTREQFGQKITSFQGIQWMIADMGSKIEAARALVYASAKAADEGKGNVGGASAAAKLIASDVAMEVATNALQLYGGYGYMKEYPIEKFLRDAKITQIYEGTNQIQKSIVAHQLIKMFTN